LCALDIFVIFRLRIGVFHQQSDRRAGCASLEYTGEYLYLVFFTALRSMPAFPGGAPQQFRTDFFSRDFQARRAAIDDAADGRTVTLAKSADPQHMSKTVVRHLV